MVLIYHLAFNNPILNKINDGAYLGSNVTVLESVIIGSQSIIGAKSLVNRDIQDHVIAFGVPCKVQGPINS